MRWRDRIKAAALERVADHLPTRPVTVNVWPVITDAANGEVVFRSAPVTVTVTDGAHVTVVQPYKLAWQRGEADVGAGPS